MRRTTQFLDTFHHKKFEYLYGFKKVKFLYGFTAQQAYQFKKNS